MAAVRDRQAGRLTAVLPVTGTQFANQDAATQDGLLAGWGDVLGCHAAVASPVVQVGWCDAARPADPDEHLAWVDELSATHARDDARRSSATRRATATWSARSSTRRSCTTRSCG